MKHSPKSHGIKSGPGCSIWEALNNPAENNSYFTKSQYFLNYFEPKSPTFSHITSTEAASKWLTWKNLIWDNNRNKEPNILRYFNYICDILVLKLGGEYTGINHIILCTF